MKEQQAPQAKSKQKTQVENQQRLKQSHSNPSGQDPQQAEQHWAVDP